MENKSTLQYALNTSTKQMEARNGGNPQLPFAPFPCRRQAGATRWIWLAATLLLMFGYCTRTIAQTHYELWFTIDRVQHHALLRQTAGQWQMRVRYEHQANGSRLIEEVLRPEQNGTFLCLRGSRIWDVHHGQLTTDYSADNIHLFYGTNGQVNGTNIDAQGAVAALVLKEIDTAALPARLRYFEWN